MGGPLVKAELHLHVEGTLEPELVFALARRNGVGIPWRDPAALRAARDFSDLQSFLDRYYEAMAVLRTAEDFADLAWAYLRRAHGDGVRHAELFFDPQAHVERGVGFDAIVDGLVAALARAEAELGVSGGLIMCFLRDRGVPAAREMMTMAAPRAGDLLGVGLDSTEIGYPNRDFAPVFAAARELGLHAVAHAGEEGAPENIWQALDALGAERIDHGTRCLEDPRLVRRLADDGVPLTVCPLSNVRLGAVASLRDHPLPSMLASGVLVTLNSDDPAYFGGYVEANYAAVAEAFGFGPEVMAAFARNSITASFAAPERKAELLAALARRNSTYQS
jgi:adenosine deaminase